MLHKIRIFSNLPIQNINPLIDLILIIHSLVLERFLNRCQFIIQILPQYIDLLLLILHELLLLHLKNFALLTHLFAKILLSVKADLDLILHGRYDVPHISDGFIKRQNCVVLLVVDEETLCAETHALVFADVLDALCGVVHAGGDPRLPNFIVFELFHVGEDVFHDVEFHLRVCYFSDSWL